MKYGVMAFFALIWMGASVVTGAVEGSDPSDTGGSSQAFEDLVNTTFATEELKVDRPVGGGIAGAIGRAISTTASFGKSAVGWVGDLFNAATLNSPIWEGWAAPIRYVILALQLPLLILIGFEGAKVVSGFIPFT